MAGPWYIVVGGSEVDIDTTYGTYTTGMVGFGMPPLTHNVYDQALTPGALLQNIKVQPRVLQLTISCRGATLAAYHSLRKLLIEACKPNYGGALTPVELRYDGAGTKVKVFGYYDAGLEGQRGPGAKTPEVIALRFICYDPWFYAMSTTTEALDENAPIANADYALRRIDGYWYNISTDFNGIVRSIAEDPSGNIYFAGSFTNVGDGDGDGIVKWNPATEALSSLSTGAGGVYCIIPDANGNIILGGAFSNVGDATGDGVVAWTGAAWQSVGSGMSPWTPTVTYVNALTYGNDGILYVGGSFINVPDGSGDNVTSLGSGWASMGTGANNTVTALATGLDGTIYATGSFTTAGGVTVNGIAQWSGAAWATVGSGTGLAGGSAVGYALAVGLDGTLYLGGSFTSVDGVSASNIARWNGTTWEALGSGASDTVYALYVDPAGLLYVGGSASTFGSLVTTNGIALWNGTTWAHLAVTIPVSGVGVRAIHMTAAGDLYLGYEGSGTAYTAGQTTVTNGGTTVAYPTITIKRVGGTTARAEYLRNETTGKTLYTNYSLLDGETLTITLTPGAKSITSSLFGNVIGRVLLPNSDFAEWCLSPGANVISLYVYEAGSPTVTASCAFVAAHWSVDGVAA